MKTKYAVMYFGQITPPFESLTKLFNFTKTQIQMDVIHTQVDKDKEISKIHEAISGLRDRLNFIKAEDGDKPHYKSWAYKKQWLARKKVHKESNLVPHELKVN